MGSLEFGKRKKRITPSKLVVLTDSYLVLDKKKPLPSMPGCKAQGWNRVLQGTHGTGIMIMKVFLSREMLFQKPTTIRSPIPNLCLQYGRQRPSSQTIMCTH